MNDATIDALRERELLDWDAGCLRRITTCANLEPNALDEKLSGQTARAGQWHSEPSDQFQKTGRIRGEVDTQSA